MKKYTDKELLELAAKAAGLEGRYVEFLMASGNVYGLVQSVGIWNPITNDGDALRLAVKLGIVPRQINGVSFAWAKDVTETIEQHNGDPYAATRRAIVRAAAEIGANL